MTNDSEVTGSTEAAAELDLTPPSTEAKPKRARKPRDPNAEVKPRAPRKDYGYADNALISLNPEKEGKYREGSARAKWFETVKGFVGRTTKEFIDASKEGEELPRGWLRFYAQDQTILLHRTATPTETAGVNS